MKGLSINNSLIQKHDVDGRNLKKLNHVTAEETLQIEHKSNFE